MLNFRELLIWLDNHMDGDYSIDKQYPKMNLYTPLKYSGIYEMIGITTIWNDVGCIEHTFYMYRPVGSGTVVYDVI